jgi:ferredoxin--NADP+ reductase
MDIEAPLIARKALPGQFIIFRVDEEGERVPLTIAGTDPESGSVRIIFQMVGKSTIRLGDKQVGDTLASFVGPLGKPSELDEYAGKRVAVIGGGLGMAIAYPQAAYLHQIGAQIDVIAGFRTRDLIILEKEMKAVSDRFHLITDDGSSGRKGFVTHVLEDLIKEGAHFDLVLAIGPLVMMRAVANLTRSHGIKTIVSMNTIMVDGTGMCGCCRLTVDGQVKFACVDGPDFDGHQVDFDESIRRSRAYLEQEAFDREEELKLHRCRLTGEVRHG